MRESEMYWGDAYSDASMARAEDMRLRYPRRAYNRSLQFADYMKDAALDWPEGLEIPSWFGYVHRWLDFPLVGEREMFEDAMVELTRLRMERICPTS